MNDDAINDKAVARIAKHWPDLDLDQYVTRWFELDDERVVLQVDYGAAMLSWSVTTSTPSGRSL
jgi:hypothetical protein